jgi:two-component system, NtrC family, sensor kinase
MRILTKVSLALGALAGVSLLFDYVALEAAVQPGFRAIEEGVARDDHARVIEAIGRLQDRLRGNATDYGRWDETYDFIRGTRPDFLKANVTEQSIRGLDVNHMAIVAGDGSVLADVGFDFSGGAAVPLRLFGRDRLSKADPIFAALSQQKALSGLLGTSNGPVAIGVTPILRSDTTGVPKAVLVVGRRVLAEELRSTTRVDLRLEPPRPGLGPHAIVQRHEGRLDVTSPLVALHGSPVATLATSRNATITATGDRAVVLALGMILAAGLVLGPLFALFLHRTVVGRILDLRRHIGAVAATGRLAPMKEDGRADEISEVGAAFNHMAAQLEDLRARLRDRDYRSGAADHAAGILHNVRNAITPVAAISSELAAASGAPWGSNLLKAVSELKDDSLDAARAEKLRRFVALTAERLVAEEEARARDVATLADMVRQVASSLADYAEESEDHRVLEPVGLRRALAHARQAIASRPGPHPAVTFDLPAEGVEVLGREPVLNQVFANLFLNAAEAIEATGRPAGFVRVTTSCDVVEGSPVLAIAVTDDGIGFDKGVGARLFERNVSSKPGARRGLGLHWCANAVNAMGGSIRAESPGPGGGAVFHLTLRLPAADKAAAA